MQRLRPQAERAAVNRVAQAERIRREKLAQNLLVAVVERFEQNRRQHLAPPIDAEVKQIAGIELKIEPVAVIGNHARAVYFFARQRDAPRIVLEKRPRRAVQLRHDDALDAVDDERAGLGHQRHFAHVNLLAFDFARALVFVEKDNVNPSVQRRLVSQFALLAFAHIEMRLAQAIRFEFEVSVPRPRFDREHGVERVLQADIFALFGRRVGLQAGAIRFFLHAQKRRHGGRGRHFRKRTARDFFLDEIAGH